MFPGNDLKLKRIERDLTIDDVYKKLRISPTVLVALEEGNLHDLPPNTYTVGFLKTYCRLLDLDPERYADAFRESTRPKTNFLGMAKGEGDAERPRWMNDLVAWASITALLALGWVSYSIAMKPRIEEAQSRVQAETLLFPDER